MVLRGGNWSFWDGFERDRVTHIVPYNDTVHELQSPDHDQEAQECVDQLYALRCAFLVGGP